MFKQLAQASKEEITQQLELQLEQREEILFSYLHGSFVEREYFRDIDIAVYVDEGVITADDALSYELELGAALQMQTGMPIDIKVLNYAPLGFQYHVTTGKVLTCKAEDLRVEVISRIWSLYFDQLPSTRRLFREMVGGNGPN